QPAPSWCRQTERPLPHASIDLRRRAGLARLVKCDARAVDDQGGQPACWLRASTQARWVAWGSAYSGPHPSLQLEVTACERTHQSTRNPYTRIYEGTNQVQRVVISKRLLP